MMNKYGVSDVCPECGCNHMTEKLVKLSDGTKQDEVECPACGFTMTYNVSEPNDDDSQPAFG